MKSTDECVPIKDFEDYQLNRKGEIIGKSGKKLIGWIRNGHIQVSLQKNGKSHMINLNRIVALQFIPNPNKFPFVMYKDKNKLNVHVDNLMWGWDHYRYPNDKILISLPVKEEYKNVDYDKFVPIEDFEDYLLNKNGNVVNVNGDKVKSYKMGNGSYKIGLLKDGFNHRKKLNRVVALQFLENPYNPLKFRVINKDGNKRNNNLNNLAWTRNKTKNRKVIRKSKDISFEPIKDFEEYKINPDGIVLGKKGRRLKNIIINRPLKIWHVALRKDNRYHFKAVASLVALQFLPNPENKEFIKYLDGDRSNLNVNNLKWITRLELNELTHNKIYIRKLSVKDILYIRDAINNKDKGQKISRLISELAKELNVHYETLKYTVTKKRWEYVELLTN